MAFGSFFHRGFDDRRECPLRVVSGHVRTAAYGPEAEVREVHTFDATPILRMTASAYKRPVTFVWRSIFDRLESARSGRSGQRVFWESPTDHLMSDQGVVPSAFCDQRQNRTLDTRIFSQSENQPKKTHRD